MSDAYLEHATRMVHGYFESRQGRLHFSISVEDSESHKIIQRDVADGEPLAVMNGVAKRLDPEAHSFPTANSEAASAWGHGDYEQAVTIDPDFSAAWLSWAQTLAAGGKAALAAGVTQRALMHPGLRSPVDRARIELLAASLRDDGPARIRSLKELARLIPADTSSLRALAEAEMNARQFQEAAGQYRDLAQSDPGDAGLKNMLGYAESFAGNLDAAQKAFEAYGREPGQAVNALDSLGEGFFVNGKFEEAEKAFLEAYSKDSSFLGGVDLWKAAHARWLRGDLKGADGLIDRYLEDRAKSPAASRNPLLMWRRVNWLYETGRRQQAIEILMHAPPQAMEVAQKQLAVWRDSKASAPSNLTQLKELYNRTNPTKDGLVRTFYAAALFEAGQKDEARRLIALWPLPDDSDSLFQAFMYPKYLELRKALL